MMKFEELETLETLLEAQELIVARARAELRRQERAYDALVEALAIGAKGD